MEAVYAPMLPTGDSKPIVRVDRQEQINSEIEILKSRFLAEKVVKSLGPEVIYKRSDDAGGGPLFISIAVFRFTKTLNPMRFFAINPSF